VSSTATDSALTFWDLDTRRSGPTIPANVTSASWSARNLFVGNWLAKPVVNSTCASPAWNGVRQVLPRVQGLSGLHCSNTRMAHIYSTFCACRPFLLTGASVDRPETRVLFPSHSPLTQAPSPPYTASAELPAAYQSVWCVVRKDGSGQWTRRTSVAREPSRLARSTRPRPLGNACAAVPPGRQTNGIFRALRGSLVADV
jgi:hypothetical protein